MSILKQFDLSGRTALVTGCKRGIGFAMAEGLAEAGADIIGVSAHAGKFRQCHRKGGHRSRAQVHRLCL